MKRLTIALALIFSGCSFQPEPPPATYRVQGRILQANGQPASGIVRFHAKDWPGNDAMAKLARDGSFKLGTFSKEDGAIPGKYKVTVHPEKPPSTAIPKKYTSEDSSPVIFDVKEKENQVPVIRLR